MVPARCSTALTVASAASAGASATTGRLLLAPAGPRGIGRCSWMMLAPAAKQAALMLDQVEAAEAGEPRTPSEPLPIRLNAMALRGDALSVGEEVAPALLLCAGSPVGESTERTTTPLLILDDEQDASHRKQCCCATACERVLRAGRCCFAERPPSKGSTSTRHHTPERPRGKPGKHKRHGRQPHRDGHVCMRSLTANVISTPLQGVGAARLVAVRTWASGRLWLLTDCCALLRLRRRAPLVGHPSDAVNQQPAAQRRAPQQARQACQLAWSCPGQAGTIPCSCRAHRHVALWG